MTRIDSFTSSTPGLTAARGDTGAEAEAWRREMERAQMADWFHGPLAFRPDHAEEAMARPTALAVAPSHVAAASPLAGSKSAQPAPDNAPHPSPVRLALQAAPARAGTSHSATAHTAAAYAAVATHATDARQAIDAVHAIDAMDASALVVHGSPAQNVTPAPTPASPSTVLAPTQPKAADTEHARADLPAGVVRLHGELQSQLAPAVELAPLQPRPAQVPRVVAGDTATVERSAASAAVPAGTQEMPVPAQVPAALSRSELSLAPAAQSVRAAIQEDAEPSAAMPAGTRTRSQPARCAVAEPVRATAVWQDDKGVFLWLGVDATGLGELAGLMTRIETWLRSQGVRLLGVTCNGRRWQDPFTYPIPSEEQ
jgi:hypothetical protein